MYVIHQPRFVLKQGRFSLRFLASFQGLCKISNIFYFHPSSFHLHLGEQTKHIPPNHQPLRTKKTTPLIFHDQHVCFPISHLTWLQESGTWITSTINQPTGHPLPLPQPRRLALRGREQWQNSIISPEVCTNSVPQKHQGLEMWPFSKNGGEFLTQCSSAVHGSFSGKLLLELWFLILSDPIEFL